MSKKNLIIIFVFLFILSLTFMTDQITKCPGSLSAILEFFKETFHSAMAEGC